MNKTYILLAFLIVGCSSANSSPEATQNSGTVFYVGQVNTVGNQFPDTLVFTNGVLDSERIHGFAEEWLTFNSSLAPSEQVYDPGWTPFAFEVLPTAANTYSWSPSKDTIGIGTYDLTYGYAVSGEAFFIKSE